MTRWNPGKRQRGRTLASLDAYLDAIATISGRYRDHRMSACLLRKRGRSPERTLRDALAGTETRIESIAAPTRWTDIERYLRQEFLPLPFRQPADAFGEALIQTRTALAFNASDLVMFLARDFEPGPMYPVELAHPQAMRYTGCLIDYRSDALWISSLHRAPSPDPARPSSPACLNRV